MEATILGHLAMVLAAIGANNVLLLANTPTTLDDGLLALLIRGEIRGERNNTVELLEINHNAELFLNYITNLRKVQRL